MNHTPTAGILIYRASRVEALLEPLEALLAATAPDDPLQPAELIAAHPGMRHWLLGALARRRGGRGIVADLDIRLASQWLDDIAQRVLGAHAVALAPYRRESLRWAIHDLLPALPDPALAAYLGGTDAARRRFQLADRLARLYTRYLVYRPDWLEAWQRGREPVPDAGFQPELWRRLRERIGQPHRAERLRELLARLERGVEAASETPLHVFGLSHLAPVELAILRALSRQRLVVLYLPDPCREHWAGLRPERAELRRLARLGNAADLEREFLELGHPLLADWGRLGQHFALSLHEGEEQVRLDTRHWEDLAPADDGLPLLAQVQESIRRLDPGVVQPLARGAGPALCDCSLRDRSLRVHACHTRLRELEVLRDALLYALREHPDLSPSDIVVMAPDIHDYLPLLPAVFGEPGRHAGALPYHLADAAAAHGHPVFETFQTLLALPGSRLTAPEVLDLLGRPAVAAALGLDAAALDALAAWLRESRVAWGLDAEFRQRAGAPAIAEHTFAWALDRLLAGYAFGAAPAEEPPDEPLAQVWPVAGVHGAQAPALGALDRLLREVARLDREAARPQPLSAWVERLLGLAAALLRAEPDDVPAREALAVLRRLIFDLRSEGEDAGLDPELEFAVVREVLARRLASATQRQRFLLGGATFCGMVPQRAIPFRVVAVLGLNDGEFPRQGGDAGLDLIARHPRLGDRDVRDDDRYLFLETLMAARQTLHLSYLGQDVREGRPRNPASVLAQLLSFLDERAGLAGDEEASRPWVVRHPLQPFDRRYFDGADPRLFSFRSEYAHLASGPAGEPAAEPAASRFVPARAAPSEPLAPAEPPVPADGIVPLATLRAFYRDPARHLLGAEARLRLEALEDDALPDSEPLDPKFAALERVGRRLFFDSLQAGCSEPPLSPPAWLALGGLLPPGRAGSIAYRDERERVCEVLEQARKHPLLADDLPAPLALAAEVDLGPLRVQGQIERVYRHEHGLWLFDAFVERKNEAELEFKERIPLFLEWALLRASRWPEPVRLCALTRQGEGSWVVSLNALDDRTRAAVAAGEAAMLAELHADLLRRLRGLAEYYLRSRQRPGGYFPKASWRAGRPEAAPAQVAAAFDGSGHGRGERDFGPGYARLLARGVAFADGGADFLALQTDAIALRRLIEFDTGAPS